jgi:pyrroloquinoline quinone biosynthesis protein D
VRDLWVLLAPERTINLDPIGLAILNEIDGQRSFGEVVARLADTYAAPVDQITSDVAEFLTGLTDRRILELI